MHTIKTVFLLIENVQTKKNSTYIKIKIVIIFDHSR